MCFPKGVILSFYRNLSVALVLEHLEQTCFFFFFWERERDTAHYHLPRLHNQGLFKKKILWRADVVARGSFVKKVFLKISQNVQEKTCLGVFFTELQIFSLELYRKKDSGICVFLRTSQIFSGQVFQLLEERWNLLQTVPIAITNNNSKANYQKRFIYFVFWDQLWVDSRGELRT